MECLYLAPYPQDGERPPAAPIHWIDVDDDWTEAPELGMLARVFNQDTYNLPRVQLGLHATRKEFVQFGTTARPRSATSTRCWRTGSRGSNPRPITESDRRAAWPPLLRVGGLAMLARDGIMEA